ncbi:MAG: DUF4175 domain-containing protein [Planctomycetes bacterium]|nr:DUF4175 domain-containing protein [Planctomycetota bacterium]
MSARPPTDPHARLDATPALERVLSRVGHALSTTIAVHGLATVVALTLAWIGWCWFADFVLRVPYAVRVVHLVAAIVVPCLAAWHFVVRPWKRRPERAGLAMLVERSERSLGELFVSAVELQRSSRPSGDPERIREVLADAERRASALALSPELARVVDRRPALVRGGLAALCVVLGVFAATRSVEHTRIFFARLAGGTTAWPQRTHLFVSIPVAPERANVTVAATEIAVRVARGVDLPVLVRAEGVVPEEVVLALSGGEEIALSESSDGEFRAVLRALQEDFSFHVAGGDDPHGDKTVSVTVLEPPDLAGLAIRIVPPAYTGLPERLERDHDVRVPAGSKLAITILPYPADARGEARILPEDRALELVPVPFPTTDEPGGPTEPGLGFELVAERSLRYRFRLTDSTGLENPDPGLFAVEVAEDRPPEVEWIFPGRSDFETVRTGELRIVARAEDDFGLRSLAWRATRSTLGANAPATASPGESHGAPNADSTGVTDGSVGAELERLVAPPRGANSGATSPRREAALGTARLAAKALVPAGVELVDGEQLVLVVTAADDRPDTGTEADEKRWAKSAALRVRIITDEEFLRRLQDRLSRVRVQVGELEELARAKQKRVSELVAALESDAPGSAASAGELAALLSGVRRVQVDAEGVTRELAAITEGVLYARLEESAGALLELLDAANARATSREFRAEVWRDLRVALGDGRAGAANGLAPALVGLVDAAREISHVDFTTAASRAETASEAVDLGEVHAALLECATAQANGQAHIEELLARLVEWDDFQSVVSLAREILARQKSLLDRTRSSAQEK